MVAIHHRRRIQGYEAAESGIAGGGAVVLLETHALLDQIKQAVIFLRRLEIKILLGFSSGQFKPVLFGISDGQIVMRLRRQR